MNSVDVWWTRMIGYRFYILMDMYCSAEYAPSSGSKKEDR